MTGHVKLFKTTINLCLIFGIRKHSDLSKNEPYNLKLLVVPNTIILEKRIFSRENAIKTLIFDIISDEEFERIFLNILSRGYKDNTYKFALARFLLDYCNGHGHVKTHVDFVVIAEYFLKYYWIQTCKLKMKHAPQATKKPEIVKIIEKEFDKPHYPQTFEEIRKLEPEKIQKCISQIVKMCFHNVTWRFQRVKINKATEARLFFDYEIERTINSNKKIVDLDYGINLNPNAIRFFQRYNAVLLKTVILEWARFLEKLNVGLPKIIAKTEGKNIKRKGLVKYRQLLEPFFGGCFYCKEPLQAGSKTHVEHVIPFDYIAEDDIWNLTLVCQQCNLHKLGALPPMKYVTKLIERNKEYRKRIPILEKSLISLEADFERVIMKHYENAQSHGYMLLREFP